MSDTVIRVENLGKKYIIGHQKQEGYTALRDVLAEKARFFGQIFSRNSKQDDPTHEEFWALKDVSFEIKQGDRVGIIGRNGAGKSTLLKILSRITEPTEGRISIKGRVASLLEVGTGFHPELTGRENIYLNGAILGMNRAEIKKKFDEIVAFAEVEKFLDTPVKRYSSGMYVRLAFAVAAHLEPEILIVDEVLAVGDAQFQRKCLGKMEDVAEEGRTVLFVSHNMSTIKSLCKQCIFLASGKILIQDESSKVIQRYLQDSSDGSNYSSNIENLPGKPKIKSAKIDVDEDIKSMRALVSLEIISTIEVNLSLDIRLYDHLDQAIGFGSIGTIESEIVHIDQGVNIVQVVFSVANLAVGNYSLSIDLTNPRYEYYDRVDRCLKFEINRPPLSMKNTSLKQSWGYGSMEIPLTQLSIKCL